MITNKLTEEQNRQSILRLLNRQLDMSVNELANLTKRKANNEKFADEDNWEITDMHIFNTIDELARIKQDILDFKNV